MKIVDKLGNDITINNNTLKIGSFSKKLYDYSNTCLITKSKLRSRQNLKKNGHSNKNDNVSISQNLSSTKKHCTGQ